MFNYLGDLFAAGDVGSPAGFFVILAKAGKGSDLCQWRQQEKGSKWKKKLRNSLCACRPFARCSLLNIFFHLGGELLSA